MAKLDTFPAVAPFIMLAVYLLQGYTVPLWIGAIVTCAYFKFLMDYTWNKAFLFTPSVIGASCQAVRGIDSNSKLNIKSWVHYAQVIVSF